MGSRKKRKESLTKVKTAREINDVKKAVGITGGVFREMDNPFGRSEQDVAREIRLRARMMGASLSFMPIVASGSNSGYVHHRPGRKIVRENEPVVFDIGFKFRGQCSDVTRMHIPKSKKFRKLHSDMLRIQKLCISRAVPGKSLKEINELFKKLMKRKGYAVKHGIGHGVGFRVHERVKGALKPGMVITVEPGVYEKGKGGCRIEDMVLITGNKPIVLTKMIRFKRRNDKKHKPPRF